MMRLERLVEQIWELDLPDLVGTARMAGKVRPAAEVSEVCYSSERKLEGDKHEKIQSATAGPDYRVCE